MRLTFLIIERPKGATRFQRTQQFPGELPRETKRKIALPDATFYSRLQEKRKRNGQTDRHAYGDTDRDI